jgi:2-oxoisovalerate dehydrogenase E2 component (dihydrolipoyl transacylase)
MLLYAIFNNFTNAYFRYSTYIDLTNLHNLLPIMNAHIPRHFLLDPPPERPILVNPSAIHPASEPSSVPDTAKYRRLTYLPFLLKTLSLAMSEWPLFRSSISQSFSSTDSNTTSPSTKPSPPTLTIRPTTDISIALSTPTGLYTPTLPSVSTHSTYALASSLAHLSALGRQTPCGLTAREMPKKGGTVTVSNVGAVGKGEFAAPVLVPGGGVTIVAIGRARWVWDVESGDGKGEKRLKVGVSWSADHRVVEGAELAAFVECWRGYVEQPERMVALGV